MILSDLSVPLEGKDPLKIRKILKEYLEEDLDKENETLMDRLKSLVKNLMRVSSYKTKLLRPL